jgi:hypothetical protein
VRFYDSMHKSLIETLTKKELRLLSVKGYWGRIADHTGDQPSA